MENTQSRFVQDMNAIKSRNTDNAIYFNFSYSALKLLGKNLYNNAASAISELVANGLDAKAHNIYVYIDMSDKAHSIIEIIDDGIGMNYDDLADKYVWVGRNKRDDADLADIEKKNVMGRKGIGKLAALFLSDHYVIATKKENEEIINQWEINLRLYNDSDFPKMDRIQNKYVFATDKIWESFQHGTIIQLNDVDLRRNGVKRLEALKQVFADYYLLEALDVNIYVAIKNRIDQEVIFEKVRKNIAFKNFYAIFDNTDYQIKDKLSGGIAFTWLSPYEHIGNQIRPTVIIDSNGFSFDGQKTFQTENGQTITKKYRLSGWIGVHCTIESKNAVDDRFLRNDVYQPNRLRLYVRNKLAVSNYFDIRRSTQTMADYIEGEISFDILDDNDLPDIATSSRQDFLSDERVDLLISLVDPIVNALFKTRNEIGQKIRSENEEYRQQLLSEEKEKRKAEEQARVKAEEERKNAEVAKLEAERKQKIAEQEVQKYHKQSTTVFNAMSEDQKSFSSKTHLVKTNALTIRNSVSTLAKKIGIDSYRELSAISVASDKILSALKYSALAKFNIEDEFITEDLFVFCNEYLLNILSKQYYDVSISTMINGECRKRFRPQYISLLLDNLLSNSEKSNSTKIMVEMVTSDGAHTIVISDNGDGFGTADMDRVFEFGFSNTGGTGIGLYNVKTVVEKMNGKIKAMNNEPQGAKFVISLHK